MKENLYCPNCDCLNRIELSVEPLNYGDGAETELTCGYCGKKYIAKAYTATLFETLRVD